MCTIDHVQNAHTRMVLEVGEQLWRDEEVPVCQLGGTTNLRTPANSLSCILGTRHLHQLIVHVPLRPLVHALVDLVDQRERRSGHLGEGHQICDRGERAFLRMSLLAQNAACAK